MKPRFESFDYAGSAPEAFRVHRIPQAAVDQDQRAHSHGALNGVLIVSTAIHESIGRVGERDCESAVSDRRSVVRQSVVRRDLAQDALVVIAAGVALTPAARVVVAGLFRQQRLVVLVRARHVPRLPSPGSKPERPADDPVRAAGTGRTHYRIATFPARSAS